MRRRLLVSGGLAVAAGALCGLLSSGAASARSAADSITVSGVAKGTSITFTGSGSSLGSVSLLGGSNWHFTAISTSGGSCSLTPTDGGGFCAFPTPVTSFVIHTTISSSPAPTEVAGEVGYADASTGTFSAPVVAAPKCHCTKLSAKLSDFREDDNGVKLVFFLKWRLDCSAGTPGFCSGAIHLEKPELPHGLRLRRGRPFASWSPRESAVIVQCHKISDPCGPQIEGEYPLELVGLPEVRAHETITFRLPIYCIDGKKSEEDLTLKFDRAGNLERRRSHLGKLS